MTTSHIQLTVKSTKIKHIDQALKQECKLTDIPSKTKDLRQKQYTLPSTDSEALQKIVAIIHTMDDKAFMDFEHQI